ncbi:MAG: DUF3276 family protein [Spirochaetia bacterium]
MGRRGELHSETIVIGKRTYFFNVKENRHGDMYLNIVESRKREGQESFERHSILVFKDDMQEFLKGFEKTLKFIQEN